MLYYLYEKSREAFVYGHTVFFSFAWWYGLFDAEGSLLSGVPDYWSLWKTKETTHNSESISIGISTIPMWSEEPTALDGGEVQALGFSVQSATNILDWNFQYCTDE